MCLYQRITSGYRLLSSSLATSSQSQRVKRSYRCCGASLFTEITKSWLVGTLDHSWRFLSICRKVSFWSILSASPGYKEQVEINPFYFPHLLTQMGPLGVDDFGITPILCWIHRDLLCFQAVETAKRERPEDNYRFKFLSYSQSGACMDMTDSSVSYAAGALTV